MGDKDKKEKQENEVNPKDTISNEEQKQTQELEDFIEEQGIQLRY